MKTFLLFATLSAGMFLSQCGEPGEGGPCTYDITTKPAVLIELIDIDESTYEAAFEVVTEKYKDTIYYSRINGNGYLMKSVLPKANLVLGKQYQYISGKILTGTCAPEYDLIKLE